RRYFSFKVFFYPCNPYFLPGIDLIIPWNSSLSNSEASSDRGIWVSQLNWSISNSCFSNKSLRINCSWVPNFPHSTSEGLGVEFSPPLSQERGSSISFGPI